MPDEIDASRDEGVLNPLQAVGNVALEHVETGSNWRKQKYFYVHSHHPTYIFRVYLKQHPHKHSILLDYS